MNPTVLVVDDSRLNRQVIKLALAPIGYRIIEAQNGQEAIDRLQTQMVDLILLDLIMPVMDGFEFLEWRRNNPPCDSIPVIVSSSLDDFESIERALGLDTYDYFIKPLTAQDLKNILPLKLKNAIHAKKLYDQLKESNERFQREVELAATYQRFLLPDDPKLAGLSLATFYQPFSGVAGDFFDVVALEDGVAFLIADASGHGLLSAMVSSLLKPLFQQYISQTRSPAETFTRLNGDLMRLTRDEDYITAFCVVYERSSSRLTYASAGHPEQLLWQSRSGQAARLGSEGFFLGMFPCDHQVFIQEEKSLEVVPGDRLLLFTDGCLEARDPDGVQFGPQRWLEAFQKTTGSPTRQASGRLWETLIAHAGAKLQDDVAFMIIQFGEESGS